MKRILFTLLALVMTMGIMAEDQFVNLTPRPKSITVGTGVWTMPQTLTIGTGQLSDEYVAEAQKFAEVLRVATSRNVTVSATSTADIVLQANADITNPEGYKVTVSATGITAEASTTTGMFYALQTIKKIMPANVMAGVYDPEVTEFTAPVCTINDEPRFEYRGFMLDVSRHFFDVAQVKRMLDVMAYYKLNKFHWHLSDDQGWRIEIKKYPKLTTIGATRDYSWEVDPVYGGYNTYEPYGPYSYTQEEAKEVVEYAAKLHIEVIPEIDMPGHFVAAMTAYPEYSCWPNGAHSVWTTGGISSDVLNVANPKAVQFAKDIITELAAIFPSKNFHIGGDECPTSAWEGNAECQALKAELGLSSYRALQSHFIKQIDEHAKSLGKHLFMWNESISAAGADQDIIQNTGATIMCWTNPYPAALTAAQRGLDVIITPWGPYYINRVQSTDPGEPVGAGNGADTAERTYNEVPVPTNVPADLQKYYKGVQGTFWCEHVGSRYLLEYLALPRLICIAEAGWTPQNLKNWEDFKKRWNEDYKILDYNGYYYGKHFLEKKNDEGSSNDKVMPKDGAYYRIVTTATDAARANACIEVLPEGSSKIGTGNAKAYRLWQMPQAAEGASNYDYQWFTFELDPNGSGFYAMVCKALPGGSVNPTPTATNNTGRWDYDRTTKHYAFELGGHTYGQLSNGNYKYSIHSQRQPSNMYMNAAAGGQQYSVNQWSDPADGNGGIWEFVPAAAEVAQPIDAPWPAVGSIVRIENNVKAGILLYSDGTGTLKNGSDPLTSNAWQIVSYGEISANGGSRNVQLQNYFTKQYLASTTSTPVTLGATPTNVTLSRDTTNNCWNLNKIVPISAQYHSNPGCCAADGVYPLGAGWQLNVVRPITIHCVDTDGQAIGEYNTSLLTGQTFTEAMLPTIKNHSLVSFEKTLGTDDQSDNYQAVYKRSAYNIAIVATDDRGIILMEDEANVPVGQEWTIAWPVSDFYTFASSDINGTTLQPTADMTLTAKYTTGDALMGFARVGEAVSTVEDGHAYLFYDACTNDNSRTGYLYTDGSKALFNGRVSSGGPAYVWTLKQISSRYRIQNEMGLYVPSMLKGTNMTASTTAGESFTLSYDNSSERWTITGGSTGLSWDSNSGGGFTGWTGGGHPHTIHKVYGQPYYYVTIVETVIDENGMEVSQKTESTLVAGGSDQRLLVFAPERSDYMLSIDGDSELSYVKGNLTVNVTYTHKNWTGITVPKDHADADAYDLSGRRTKQQTGVVIKEGKKVKL